MAGNMGKLVRDRIPDIIRQAGKTCTIRTLSAGGYDSALRAKLLEDAQGVIAAAPIWWLKWPTCVR
ncbi:MAG: hypothetical protein ACFBSG_10705 [Leptolyngbyaceae cyanobacterium]